VRSARSPHTVVHHALTGIQNPVFVRTVANANSTPGMSIEIDKYKMAHSF